MAVPEKSILWVDGAISDCINAADRGLAYGDGLFETMRYENGDIPLLDLHLRRLSKGCQVLCLKEVEPHLAAAIEQLKVEMRTLADAGAAGAYVFKLIVTRGLGGKGYVPASVPTPPSIILRITPLLPENEKHQAGVSLQLCRWRLSLSPLLAGIKHLNRLEYVMAAQELIAKDGVQGLLTDANGSVVEGLHHNIFIVKQGELITPRISMCGVRGVARELIIERLAPAIGMAVSEQELSIDDLIGAQEMFLCNSVHGLWPVTEFRSRSWPPGEITLRLQELLAEIWRGGDAS